MPNGNYTKTQTEQVELTDEQLSQVVGGCGDYERRDDDDDDDNWGERRRRRHHHHGGCGYEWGHHGYDSYESDYTEERHTHRSSCW